jgi:phosphatidate cytidylyltransferase
MSPADHRKRIVTGLSLAACLAAAVAVGGKLSLLLVLAASSLALWEFFAMRWPGRMHTGRKILGMGMGAALLLSQPAGPQWMIATLGVCVCLTSLLFLADFGRGNVEARFADYSPLLHGLVYIPLALQLALSFSRSEQCLVLLAAVATDAGGYYAGTYLGERRIWPVISPNKTWAGFAGGTALCLTACTAQGALGALFSWSLPSLSLWAWGGLGLLLSLAAHAGDFFESALKRSLHIKDSGHLLPGHGGMLDRIDSLLFVLPVYACVRLALSWQT